MSTDKLTFDQIDEKLAPIVGQPGVAESHGTMCGILCGGGTRLDDPDWLQQIFPGMDLSPAALSVLKRLFMETRIEFEDNCFTFSPLLPDDSRSIGERIAALGEWCQGFMLGLSLGGLQQTDRLSSEVQELLRDLAEMSQVDSYQLEGGEQDERSYMELVEYLRTGVLLLHAELDCVQQPALGSMLH